MVRRLDARAADFAGAFDTLLSAKRETDEDVSAAVRAIIADVRTRGDAALIDYSERFDKVQLTAATLRLSSQDIAAAEGQCGREALSALDVAAKRIEDYHRRQLPPDTLYTDSIGAQLGWRWTALDSVGLYVPGGTASYPSSVLMNAIPARVAGVKRVVMVTPASGGAINPLSIEAARRAGVSEIYRIGGAQAIAALAFGTQSVIPVDKIVGPGNAYVAAAKREVFGHVGIDSVAGPSEISDHRRWRQRSRLDRRRSSLASGARCLFAEHPHHRRFRLCAESGGCRGARAGASAAQGDCRKKLARIRSDHRRRKA